ALVRERGAPEFVARAVRDWIEKKGSKTCFIEPGSPWQNAYIESFHSRFRDEFLNLEVLGSLQEATMSGDEHRCKHNHQRPHSTLGGLPLRGSRRADLLRCGLRCPLRRAAPDRANPDSRSSWFKEGGLQTDFWKFQN
ncbi:MAG: integrase core domain-containing protein, partial [Verrucomicrobiales bacterium]